MKKPPRRSRAPKRLEEVGRLQAGRTEAEGDRRDHQREPAELEREQELADELAAVGIRGPDRRDDRLAGQDHHVPDLLEQALGGQERPVSGGADHQRAGCAVANGHPPETFTRHQLISAPSGPSRGLTCQVEHPSSPVSADETTSQRWPAGSASIASRTSRARRSRRARPIAAARAAAELGEQRVARGRELGDSRHAGLSRSARAPRRPGRGRGCSSRARPRAGRSAGAARAVPRPRRPRARCRRARARTRARRGRARARRPPPPRVARPRAPRAGRRTRGP